MDVSGPERIVVMESCDTSIASMEGLIFVFLKNMTLQLRVISEILSYFQSLSNASVNIYICFAVLLDTLHASCPGS